MNAGPRRRSTASTSATGLNYAAVGATATSQVLSYPPTGFRASEFRHRIGSGARRFDVAGRSLMTWGVLRGAGVGVEDVAAASEVSRGLGGPLFLEDGTPWITPGMTATLLLVEKPIAVRAPVRVISIVDEPGRIGFAFGSCPGHPAQMEQLLLLEHDDDESVWLTMRSIWRASSLKWRVPAAAYSMADKHINRRFLTALHPSHAA